MRAVKRRAQRRDLKQERARRTRDEILQAAIDLFARRGIPATTMAELARAIQMTPGALYWHFPTKEELLLAALEELHGRFMNAFGRILEEARAWTARRQLEAFLETTQDFLRRNKEHGIFFGMLSAESAEGSERVAQAVRDILTTYVGALASIVKYGQQKTGEFRADVDPWTFGHMLLAANMGIIVHAHLYRQTLSYDPLAAALHLLTRDAVDARAPKGP